MAATMLDFVPYTREWTEAVDAFNRRMLAGGLECELRFPEQPEPISNAGPKDALSREYFLAVEGSYVRGAYFLTHEHWSAGKQRLEVANFRLPLSEGFVNPKYRGTGQRLLSHALGRSPLLYCLGLGERTRPLPRMLSGQNWRVEKTAFYFLCVHPGEVLQKLTWLRANAGVLKQFMMDVATRCGGASGIAALQHVRKRAPGCEIAAGEVADFGSAADEVWNCASGDYSLLADRRNNILRVRYPSHDNRFRRLIVNSNSEVCGWVVVLATAMQNHRHFGSLKVGTVV